MTKLRLAGFSGALLVAALVGGTILSSVAAAPAAPAGPAAGRVAVDAPAPGEACATFRRAFAANLGVQESALAPAAKAASIATIDAAVAAGDMTAAAGDRLKARVAASDADGCGRFGAWIGRARAAVGAAKDGVAAAAGALDMTPAELRAQLRAGRTLKEVAAAEVVPYETVTAAIVASVKADLDAAVAAGKIVQTRADRILVRLERNLANGRLRGGPAGGGRPARPSTGS